jgi:PAS domain S-box-containing protein
MFESHAAALFGDLPDAVLIHRGGTIVYANPVAVHWLGASCATQLSGRCILELYADRDYPSAVGRLQSIHFGRSPSVPHRFRLLRLDGSEVELEMSALHLPTAQGSFVVEVLRRVDPQDEDVASHPAGVLSFVQRDSGSGSRGPT